MTRDKLIYVSNFKLGVKYVTRVVCEKSDVAHYFTLYSAFFDKNTILNNNLSFV